MIGIIVSVIIPIRFGHVLCPIAVEPLQFRLKSIVMDIQMPVEMVLCHILLPTLIEKMHYKAVLRSILKGYFRVMAELLDLKWMASHEVFPIVTNDAGIIDHNAGTPIDHDVPTNNNVPIELVDIDPVIHNDVISNFIGGDHAVVDNMAATSTISMNDAGGTRTAQDINTDDDDVTCVHDDSLDDDCCIQSLLQPSLPSQDVTATIYSLDATTSINDDSSPCITTSITTTTTPINDTSTTINTTNNTVNNVATKLLSIIRETSVTTRLSIFIASGALLLAVLSSWLLHGPLTVGRMMIELLHVSSDNDVFNYPVGLSLCGAIAFVLNFIIQDIMHNRDVLGVMHVVYKWIVRALQFVTVGMYWLVVPPFMLGIVFESLVLNPLRGNTSSASFSLLECWAFGLIGLKIWTQCVLVGLFGDIDMRVNLEVVVMRGFAQFDAWYCVRNVVIPVTLQLLDFSVVPYLLSITIQRGHVFIPQEYLPLFDLLHDWRYHVYVFLRITLLATKSAYKYIVRIHRQVRDSKYLIGTQLHNRPEQTHHHYHHHHHRCDNR